ncbi:hypothetical protein GSY69_13730 [Brevibacterium sp. 5221]|uniref:Uncharacterized protein n=1 Tax=Brevibacterium rongguiense TaxID=2695267 RepID=A0A6N9HAA2_9MICO|nr:hypothetical protein [Brevibacterium rongguiense]MYM20987.1 hypothetical protein [Brevibacterium rongguiense]
MNQVAKKFRTTGLVAVLGVLAMVMTLLSAPSAMAADASTADSAAFEEENSDARYVEADSPEEAQKIEKKLDSGVSPQAAGVKYGPCTLTQSSVYVRKSTKGVGSKPVTKCTKKVTSIHHKTQLATRTALLWWKVRSTDTGGNKGAASYTQKNVSHPCKGSKKKVWRASTTGTIVSGGKTYYAVATSGAKKLACGV